MPSTPQQLAVWVARLFPHAIFFKSTAEKVVALTIDDVPTPNDPGDGTTRLILDAIAAYNQTLPTGADPVRATFFVISGHLNDNSTILSEILQQGHEIGNHGVIDTTHAFLTPQAFEKQLLEAHERLILTTQQTTIRWYRPGRGLYNAQMREILRRLGETTGYETQLALASMLPLDTFEPTGDPQFTAWYVSQFVFPGAILVLHGGSAARARNTAAALPLVLADLNRQGYQVLTLSELWDREHQGESIISTP